MTTLNSPTGAKLGLTKTSRVVLAVILAAIVFAMLAGTALHSISTNRQPYETQLAADGLDEIPVATSERALSDFVTYTSAQPVDHVGRAKLEMAGEIFRVPAGTKVTVLSGGMTSARVNIRDGERAGTEGYVPVEWIR